MNEIVLTKRGLVIKKVQTSIVDLIVYVRKLDRTIYLDPSELVPEDVTDVDTPKILLKLMEITVSYIIPYII